MFGSLATECGYTPAEVRLMTLHDVDRINRYWLRNPPLHLIAARYAGIKPAAKPMDPNDPSVLMGNSILAGIDRARGKPKATPAVQAGGDALAAMFPDGIVRF